MRYKTQKTSLASSIIAWRLIALNSPFYRKRILVIASQCVIKRSSYFRHYYNKNFRTEVLSEWRNNAIRLMSCRFLDFLGPFNKLTALRCTETWLVRHLHKHVFHRLQFPKNISYEAQIYFLKRSKWSVDFRNAVKS